MLFGLLMTSLSLSQGIKYCPLVVLFSWSD